MAIQVSLIFLKKSISTIITASTPPCSRVFLNRVAR
jgi:hypothetical protein